MHERTRGVRGEVADAVLAGLAPDRIMRAGPVTGATTHATVDVTPAERLACCAAPGDNKADDANEYETDNGSRNLLLPSAAGAGVRRRDRERSSYPALANLLNAVGATVKPRVFCVSELADQGAGHPDFGLYAARQVQRERPRKGRSRSAAWSR